MSNTGATKSAGIAASLSTCLKGALAVFMKDLRCEIRDRHAIMSVLLFAVTSTVAVSFVLNAQANRSEVSSALLWIVIYFAAMTGLSRSFVREEDAGTSGLLKLALQPNAVYVGKLIFNVVILIAVEIVTVPIFTILMGCEIYRPGLFIALLLLGSVALAAGSTMAAAMVARASSRGALFAVIGFPLLIPVLALGISGTNVALGAGHVAEAISSIRMLFYYCGSIIPASLILFRFIWED